MLNEVFIGEPRDVYIGNPDDLTSEGLTVRSTGEAVNNATVTAQIKTTAGANVGDSASLSYVATSNGHYLGTISAAATAQLTSGADYEVWITEANGSVYRVLPFRAAYRGRR